MNFLTLSKRCLRLYIVRWANTWSSMWLSLACYRRLSSFCIFSWSNLILFTIHFSIVLYSIVGWLWLTLHLSQKEYVRHVGQKYPTRLWWELHLGKSESKDVVSISSSLSSLMRSNLVSYFMDLLGVIGLLLADFFVSNFLLSFIEMLSVLEFSLLTGVSINGYNYNSFIRHIASCHLSSLGHSSRFFRGVICDTFGSMSTRLIRILSVHFNYAYSISIINQTWCFGWQSVLLSSIHRTGAVASAPSLMPY